MPYKLVLNMPHLADGSQVGIPQLGVYTVGEDNIVSDDEARAYEQTHVDHEDATWINPETDKEEVVGRSQVVLPFDELMKNLSGVSVERITDDGEPEPVVDTSTTTTFDGSGVSLPPPGSGLSLDDAGTSSEGTDAE